MFLFLHFFCRSKQGWWWFIEGLDLGSFLFEWGMMRLVDQLGSCSLVYFSREKGKNVSVVADSKGWTLAVSVWCSSHVIVVRWSTLMWHSFCSRDWFDRCRFRFLVFLVRFLYPTKRYPPSTLFWNYSTSIYIYIRIMRSMLNEYW